MDILTLLARSWQTATTGDDSVRSARDIVERWYDKGGDLTLRTRRFMMRECLWISPTLSQAVYEYVISHKGVYALEHDGFVSYQEVADWSHPYLLIEKKH